MPLSWCGWNRAFPEYGKEMTEGHNPLEASLMEFISFNKGCYVGQEVVARLDTYDKVQESPGGAVVAIQGRRDRPKRGCSSMRRRSER